MMKFMRFCAATALAGIVPPGAADAAGPATTRVATTQHVARIGGASIRYRAIVAPTELAATAIRPAATMVSIAYLRQGVPLAGRPVTFIFNGGPGAPSSLLHLLALGPRRLVLGAVDQARPTAKPQLVDNPYSLLDVSDLVFIDPIGTGLSRSADAQSNAYFGINADAQATADFIETWLAGNGRGAAPVHIIGESYGATRIVKTIQALQRKASVIAVHGAIMISGPLDYVGFIPALGDDKAYPMFVPTMAAAAWYHGTINRRGRSQEQFLSEARSFARTDFAAGLALGNMLPRAEKARLAARLEDFSGLPRQFFLDNDLRVRGSMLPAAMLAARGKVVGRYDARYTAPAGTTGDPSAGRISAAVEPALLHYLQSELGVAQAADYRFRIADFNASMWRWDIDPSVTDSVPGVYLNLEPILADELRRNPKLRVFMGAGYYDLILPFMAVEHSASHIAAGAKRVTMRNYDGGHMMYTTDANLAALSGDVHAFVAGR